MPPNQFSAGERLLVEARAGDLILWDSRTVHGGLVGTGKPSGETTTSTSSSGEPASCGITGSGGETGSSGSGETGGGSTGRGGCDLARLSLTVCMTPAALASKATRASRLRGLASGATFTHWPHEARVAKSGPVGWTPEDTAWLREDARALVG